jgi:hypothetical protein
MKPNPFYADINIELYLLLIVVINRGNKYGTTIKLPFWSCKETSDWH